ncbi:MAG: GntR family transcriptional regulator [Lachnospiraceae bacterium]|nr:GntR family transcriptional regulator [Lachnospiraceae bacterium]
MGKLYREIADSIIESIRNCETFDKLPTEYELCRRYNASRDTVRHALSYCEELGLIEKRQGSGIYLSAAYKRSIGKIAVLVPDREDGYFPALLNLLEKILSERDHDMIVYDTHDDIWLKADILKELTVNQIRFVIDIPIRNIFPVPYPDLYKALIRRGSKIVFGGHPYPNLKGIKSACFDNYFAGFDTITRLKGRKKICFLLMSESLENADMRNGINAAIYENGLKDSLMLTYSYNDLVRMRNTLDTRTFFDRFFSGDSFPECFVTSDDETAYWLMRYLGNERISDDMVFYTLNSSVYSALCEKEPVGFSIDLDGYARALVDILLDDKEDQVLPFL